MLEEKVAKLLTPIYGADKFQVSINLDLNFDSIERKKVTYDDPEIKSETVQAAGSQGTVQEAQTGTVMNKAPSLGLLVRFHLKIKESGSTKESTRLSFYYSFTIPTTAAACCLPIWVNSKESI